MVRSSVVLRLTHRGGPDPIRELRRVRRAAQEHPRGVSWIASRKPGAGFSARADSRLLAFADGGEGTSWALTARVISRHRTLPSDAAGRDIYGDDEGDFLAYWKITEVDLRRLPYADLPGTTLKGLRIPDAFRRSQLSFAYWIPGPAFDGDVRTHRRATAPTPPGGSGPGSPTVPLHGVDFSGARETGGRNRKIWIASWYPDRNFVELTSGRDDPGFDRRQFAAMVIRGGGTWVIDFPFGPPAAVAEAAGWTTWRDYIDWCASDSDPTALRDELRERCRLAGLRWAQRREIDRSIGTTWFPFFEQLYRQTITGGRDVLGPLTQAGRDTVRILPFHRHAPATAELSVVVEGFPGATLKEHGLPATGYKKRGGSGERKRCLIIESLRTRGIPIRDMDAAAAVHDAAGDAVDALVLLSAARTANDRTAAEWSDGVRDHGRMEGWFFD